MSAPQSDDGGTHPNTGTVLAERYRLDQVIGRGGMSTVFRATDEALGRTVAVKLFARELAEADDVRRQREEVTLLASLNHPCLVTLFDAVADDLEAGIDRAFLVMEFVDGEDLYTRLLKGPLEQRTAALLGTDVADALEYIHSRGVIHRDIKPGNILLPIANDTAVRTFAKLADFGIARLVDSTRLTATGSLIGTASYLSPEQARGGGVGPPSDVYSLGLVLLESLTGERAFSGTAIEATAARLSRDPVVPESLGPAWGELLRSMTAMEPDARPSSGSVAASLREFANSGAPVAPEPTLVLPPAEVEVTEAIAQPRASAEQVTEPFARPRVAAPPRRKVSPAVWAILAAVVLAPFVYLAAVNIPAPVPTGGEPSAPAEPTEPAFEYPAVEGTLGEHLEQLQRTVEP
jgi:serine/threonine protein kinase